MGKYVYSKKYNKIFLTERFKKTDGWYREINEPHFGGSWDDIDFKVKDSIEFDNFEDLIEVGDLIFYFDDEDKIFPKSRVINNILEQRMHRMNFNGIKILEIWKRIDNTFKRICHKEEEGWVTG